MMCLTPHISRAFSLQLISAEIQSEDTEKIDVHLTFALKQVDVSVSVCVCVCINVEYVVAGFAGIWVHFSPEEVFLVWEYFIHQDHTHNSVS